MVLMAIVVEFPASQARSRTFATDFACHCPPRAVAIPPGINHPLTIAIHDAARVCVFATGLNRWRSVIPERQLEGTRAS